MKKLFSRIILKNFVGKIRDVHSEWDMTRIVKKFISRKFCFSQMQRFHEKYVYLFYYLKPIQFLKWVEKETFVRFTVSRVDEQKVESKFFRSGRFLTLTCASSLTVAPQKKSLGASQSHTINILPNISQKICTANPNQVHFWGLTLIWLLLPFFF